VREGEGRERYSTVNSMYKEDIAGLRDGEGNRR
jgi:hypothetical protein